MKTLLFAAFMLATASSSCSPSLSQEQIKVVINNCPALVNYTTDEQKKAAEELRALYTNSQLAVMLNDYAKLREACRVVNKRVQLYRKQKYDRLS